MGGTVSSVGAQHAPSTFQPLPSSPETPLEGFSHAKHRAPWGTEPGQRPVPGDGHWPGTPGVSPHRSGDPQINPTKGPATKRSR